jgi:hypothetical protein
VADFDLKRLSGLDWGVVGGAALAFIALFLSWYGWSGPGLSYSVSGFSTGFAWLGVILMVASGVYLLLQRSRVDM